MAYDTRHSYPIPAVSLQIGDKFATLLQLKRELADLDEHWEDQVIDCPEDSGDDEMSDGYDGDPDYTGGSVQASDGGDDW